MSLMEYKIRLIVLCLIVMIAGPLSIKPTLADISKDIWNKWWCVLMRWFLVIAVVVAFFSCGYYMVIGVVTKEEIIQQAEVVGIKEQGSWGGFMDAYDVELELRDGSNVTVKAPFFSSGSLRKKVRNLKEGDRITVYYVSSIMHLYNFDFLETEVA